MVINLFLPEELVKMRPIKLAKRMKSLDLMMGRLKTGTPPRLNGDTINYQDLIEQPGDSVRPVFSFIGCSSQHPEQVKCHIARTNEKTHEHIKKIIKKLTVI